MFMNGFGTFALFTNTPFNAAKNRFELPNQFRKFGLVFAIIVSESVRVLIVFVFDRLGIEARANLNI